MIESRRILQELHANVGLPRLEIEGSGERSPCAMFIGWISNRIQGQKAVYLIENSYKRQGNSNGKKEGIVFERNDLEKLIQETMQNVLSTASLSINGEYIINNNIKPVKINLSLSIQANDHYIPRLSLDYRFLDPKDG